MVHSEEEDDYGNKAWDVYNKDGFSFRESGRLFDRDVVVKPAARPTASGTRGFTLYDSTRITL